MPMETPNARNAEIDRILWALADEDKSVSSLLTHGREVKINPIRYASLVMAQHALQDTIRFLREALANPEVTP